MRTRLADDPIVLMGRLINSEQRPFRQKRPRLTARHGEGKQHQQHQQKPAHITQRERQSGDQSDPIGRGDGGQHGIVEDFGNGETHLDREQNRQL